jgi:hypothetical protein
MTQATAANPLIVPAPGTPSQTGINLLDDATSVQQSIASGSWIGTGLGAVSTGLDTTMLVTNPIATVVSYGLNYLIETVKPLSDALNWLAGDAGQISAYAATWLNVAQAVGQSGQNYATSLSQVTASWAGPTATSYQAAATDSINTIKAASTAAATVGKVTELIGGMVAAARNLIRDLVTQAIGQVVQTALIALAGVTIPYVVARVATLVASWSSRIADVVRNVSGSLSKLQPLMQRLEQLWADIKQALGTRKAPAPPEPTPVTTTQAATTTATTRPWPKRADYNSPMKYGKDKHEALKDIQRPFEGQDIGNGWKMVKVERKAGGDGQVDVMYVNDAQKRIVVEDYVTGQTESGGHASKGWAYQNEPEIQALIKQGYTYEYVPSFTDKLQ